MNFHGHICPGLCLGYKASILAIKTMKEKKAEDEEILAICENDSCFVDAVQVITGCTLGKGNLILKNYGKVALSLISRNKKKGIRVAPKANTYKLLGGGDFFNLMEKVAKGLASESEKNMLQELKLKRSTLLLQSDAQEIFSVREIEVEIPPPARIVKSMICDVCGEPVMETKVVEDYGRKICLSCAEKAQS